MKPGDLVTVQFGTKSIQGTVKAASDYLVVVEEAPGFVMMVRKDPGSNLWHVGKSLATFTIQPRMTKDEVSTRLYAMLAEVRKRK